MLARTILTLTIALSLSATAVRAQAPYVDIERRLSAEQVHATGLDTLSAAQLALLNRLLREESAKVATAPAARVAQPNQPRADGEPSRAWNIGLDDKPIVSRLKGSVSGWEPGTEFELENGQRWKVLHGAATLRKPLDSPEIQVIPGVAGRWFLQVDENMPKARVYRVD